jgi:hypothetical protein
MKHVKLFESFLESEWLSEASQVTLSTELPPQSFKPDILGKIKSALGIGTSEEISPEKIKSAQKKNKVKETGKLDVMTVLSLLKGSPPKETEKPQISKEIEKDEIPPLVSTSTNESYYINEADVSSGGLSIVKILNSIEPQILSAFNTQLDKDVNSKSPWKKTYEVGIFPYLASFTFSIGYKVKMTSVKAKSASFKPAEDLEVFGIKIPTSKGKGWYIAKALGNVKGTVFIDFGWVKYNINIDTGFGLVAWANKVTSPDGTIEVNPPTVSITTSPIDIGIGYLSLKNNKLVLTNALFGTFDYLLPIQDSLDKCFNPQGGPFISKIKDLEKNLKV